jgi:hypothetical protein
VHHLHQRPQNLDGKYDLLAEREVRGIRLQHPQRDLQRLAIGMLHGR